MQMSRAYTINAFILQCVIINKSRDVSTGATAVAPKFSDTLTLFQPGGGEADSAHHWRGRT